MHLGEPALGPRGGLVRVHAQQRARGVAQRLVLVAVERDVEWPEAVLGRPPAHRADQRQPRRPVAVIERHLADELPRLQLGPPPLEHQVHVGALVELAAAPVPLALPAARRLGQQVADVARRLELAHVPRARRGRALGREVHRLELAEALVGAQPVEVGVLADQPLAAARDVAAVGAGRRPREPLDREPGELLLERVGHLGRLQRRLGRRPGRRADGGRSADRPAAAARRRTRRCSARASGRRRAAGPRCPRRAPAAAPGAAASTTRCRCRPPAPGWPGSTPGGPRCTSASAARQPASAAAGGRGSAAAAATAPPARAARAGRRARAARSAPGPRRAGGWLPTAATADRRCRSVGAP